MTKSTATIIGSLVALLLFTLLFGCKSEKVEKAPEQRTRQTVYYELLEMERRNPDRFGSPFSKANDLIRELHHEVKGEPTDSMRILLTRIADNFNYDDKIRAAAIEALILFPPDKTQRTLEACLENETLAEPAAGILLKNGITEKAIPVVIQHEAWHILRSQPDSIAVPILTEAASGNSKTAYGRIKAAVELRNHGDAETGPRTARVILHDCLNDNEMSAGDYDLAKAIRECCSLLEKETDPGDIELLQKIAHSPQSNFQSWAVNALFARAKGGDDLARETLKTIAGDGDTPAAIAARSKLDQLEHKQ